MLCFWVSFRILYFVCTYSLHQKAHGLKCDKAKSSSSSSSLFEWMGFGVDGADLSGTPAEKHAKAATETSNKQERIQDQESHPVSPIHFMHIVSRFTFCRLLVLVYIIVSMLSASQAQLIAGRLCILEPRYRIRRVWKGLLLFILGMHCSIMSSIHLLTR